MKMLLISVALVGAAAVVVGVVLVACVARVPSGAGSVGKDGKPRDSSAMLAVGENAPDFTVRDESGNEVALSKFKGAKNVVLVFYPGNETPGCTAQLCTIRDDWGKFEAKDTVVFGVNSASAASHSSFVDKHGFPFPLLVDADGAITRSYGSRSALGITARTVYAIDKQGRIAFAQRGMPKTDPILAALP